MMWNTKVNIDINYYKCFTCHSFFIYITQIRILIWVIVCQLIARIFLLTRYIQSQAIKFALATTTKYQNCCTNFFVNETLIVKIVQWATKKIPETWFKGIIAPSTV